MRGLPPLGFGGSSGKSGSITSHSSSLTSFLAMMSPYPTPGFVRRIQSTEPRGALPSRKRSHGNNRCSHISASSQEPTCLLGAGLAQALAGSRSAARIFSNTGIKYLLKVSGFSHIGKCPISSMIMHSDPLTFLAVSSVISGVQAKS
jgi:hypothetical protein